MPTLLGAHVVPKEFQGSAQEYVEACLQADDSEVAKRKLARLWTCSPTAARSARKTQKKFSRLPRITVWECGRMSAS